MAGPSKVAIVTGSARPWGLGRATALGFARKGFDIVVADIREDWGKEAAATISKETGRKALFVQMDVSKRASVEAMVQRIDKDLGRIDVLANVAAIVANERIEAITDAVLERVLSINFKGVVYTCQSVLPVMRQQMSGRIINVSSGASVQPLKGLAIYSASKAAVNQFSKVLAWEAARYGVIVTVVAPGRMITQMGSEGPPPQDEFTAEFRASPFLKALRPEEVAEVIVHAGTIDSPVLAGQTLHANGGAYMV